MRNPIHHQISSLGFNLVMGGFAATGFAVSVGVHFATFVDAALPESISLLLHLGVFVAFVPMVMMLSRRRSAGADTQGKDSPSEVGKSPLWARALLVLCCIYAPINFKLNFDSLEGGVPGQEGNRYILRSHQTIRRELTASEYHRYRADLCRMMSGHWMAFYLGPAIFFLNRRDAGWGTTGLSRAERRQFEEWLNKE